MPTDLSIVGFDGIYVHQLAELPITTIQQPLATIAQHMFALLMKQLAGETVTSVYTLYQNYCTGLQLPKKAGETQSSTGFLAIVSPQKYSYPNSTFASTLQIHQQ